MTLSSSLHLPQLGVLLVSLWFLWKLWSFFKPRDLHSLRSVAIVVLGDIGRSPRMMYHAQSFAEHDFYTTIVSYGGSKPIPSLMRPNLSIRYLPEPPRLLRAMPFLVAAPIKVALQVLSMFLQLLAIPQAPEFILVQNPPSIPTLAIVWLVSRMRGSKVIIDWHNLGYSILAMRFPSQGERHPLVRIEKWFERTFGQTAYAHLFVTKAMRDYLVKEWDLQGQHVVLHDRPPRQFHKTTAQGVHELFGAKIERSLAQELSLKGFLPKCNPPRSTVFTTTNTSPSTPPITLNPIFSEVQAPSLRDDRPALVVSSTSWTADEDFSILLDALSKYESAAASKKMLPKVLVLVTGKGPLREKYMTEIGKLQRKWKHVRCASLWLEAEDYPVLLGAADLGVCLHVSSSNLDLPMKVVDMFGCELPVCALGFDCLDELVKDGKNGLVFKDADQLADQMEMLLSGFPQCPRLDELRSFLAPASNASTHALPHAAEEIWEPWDDHWARVVRPLVLRDVQRNEGL
ncbi:Chitobiosyldiphosphodolichol beta-mannosyltransferase [Mycena kentingensis (nom. inval.)]|nr:Chitobiosyldiphosphodolichol beta-mannosyltransferase [Mycena kentingensis (nom. inval.)]